MDAILLLDEAGRQGAPIWVIDAYYDTTCRLVKGYVLRMISEKSHLEALTRLAERDDTIVEALERYLGSSKAETQSVDFATRREAVLANLRLQQSSR